MGLFAAVRTAIDSSDEMDSVDERARCRNCGRYYTVTDETCPYCGSGNKIRSGPPAGQHRR